MKPNSVLTHGLSLLRFSTTAKFLYLTVVTWALAFCQSMYILQLIFILTITNLRRLSLAAFTYLTAVTRAPVFFYSMYILQLSFILIITRVNGIFSLAGSLSPFRRVMDSLPTTV